MFYVKVNKRSREEMFNFIKNHYMFFDRDNYWYSDKTIAHNVKLYNLHLTDWSKALELLELDNWNTINTMVEDFEREHKNVEVYFNGRSGGYLILKDKTDREVYNFSDFLEHDYEDYLECVKYCVKGSYNTQKELTEELRQQVELVQDFDKLCDDLRDELQYMIDNCTIKEEEYTVVQKRRYIEYE